MENPDYDYDDNFDVPFHICRRNDFAAKYAEDQGWIRKETNSPPSDAGNDIFDFSCPKDSNEETFLTEAPPGEANLLSGGRLQIQFLTSRNNMTETKQWNPSNFCVALLEKDVNATKISQIYFTCHKTEATTSCEDKRKYLVPILMGISVFFLIITLVAYFVEGSQRKSSPLFAQITIAFIINLTIAFSMFIHEHRVGFRVEAKIYCILQGYAKQYFILAYFFWISSMSFNIWKKFTYPSFRPLSKERNYWIFKKYFLFAQGSPLIIGILTAIVDQFRPSQEENSNFNYESRHFPNMGLFLCFVGQGRLPGDQRTSYFSSPLFLYYGVFLLLIQLANVFFLGATIKILIEGWKNQASLGQMRSE